MNSLHTFSLVLATAVVLSPVPAGAQTGPDRSAQVEKALQVVKEYIAAEQSSAGERVQSRSGMLEFSFRSSRENGNYRVLSESDWREWEMERPAGVQRLQLIGQPQVESIGDDLVRVHCAVHVNTVEGGENWEGVSMRSFDVRIRDEGPRIRHERLLAAREGIKPGQWRKLRKIDKVCGATCGLLRRRGRITSWVSWSPTKPCTSGTRRTSVGFSCGRRTG